MRIRFHKPITLTPKDKTPKSKAITTIANDDAVIENGFEFYTSRDCLSKIHPLVDVFKSAKTIWAFWFTGTEAHAKDVIKGNKLERLILPHPVNSSIALLANATSKTPKELQDEIYAFTKAIQEKVQVKWYSGITSSTMMLGEPGDEDGWIQVESVIPFLLPIDSPGFRIYRCCKHKKLYDDLWQAYQALWDKSVEPTSQDLAGH